MRRSACENRGDLFLGAGSQIVDEPGCDRVVICTWISGAQGGRGAPRPARTRYQAGTHSGAHHTGDAAKRLTGALARGLGPVGIGFLPSSRGHLRYDARQPLPERHWLTGPPDGGTTSPNPVTSAHTRQVYNVFESVRCNDLGGRGLQRLLDEHVVRVDANACCDAH